MELKPILAAMWRNKTGPVLIAVQIAIALAIVTNSAFIIEQRHEKMNRPTGMDDRNIIFARSIGFGSSYDHMSTLREDMDALSAIPGVVSVGYIDAVPLSGSGSNTGFSAEPPSDDPDQVTANGNYYRADHRAMDALGVKLSEGRWFTPEEIEYRPDENYLPQAVVVTRAWADEAFGEGVPVTGKILYNHIGQSSRIVGVMEHMQGAWVGWEGLNRVLIFGAYDEPPLGSYAIRVEPGMADKLVPEIEAKLQEINRNRVVLMVRTLATYMERSYTSDSAMIKMLAGVSILLVAVTALGIVGLAAFNVNQRRKQIGTRRALGARQSDILRYFLLEAIVITTIGVTLGMLLTFLMSWWLGTQFNLPQLDWRFVPPVVLGVFLISQLAVLGPARRASRISPALATRSV